jgi:hypothetical protein
VASSSARGLSILGCAGLGSGVWTGMGPISAGGSHVSTSGVDINSAGMVWGARLSVAPRGEYGNLSECPKRDFRHWLLNLSSNQNSPSCQANSEKVSRSFEIVHHFLGWKRNSKHSLRLSSLAKRARAQFDLISIIPVPSFRSSGGRLASSEDNGSGSISCNVGGSCALVASSS